MKFKIPMWDSYKGLNYEDWTDLNNGKVVELKEIPRVALPYLKIIKKEK